jgi:hypothetical protein
MWPCGMLPNLPHQKIGEINKFTNINVDYLAIVLPQGKLMIWGRRVNIVCEKICVSRQW